MPYLQLHVVRHYPVEVKQRLAKELGDLFAHLMQTTPDKVNVGFHELSEGSLWRCGEGEPEPAAVLKCDIRRGRPPDQRAQLAQALVLACVAALELRPERLSVEFTQHSGDEIFRPGSGLYADWTPAEARRD